MQEHQTLLWDDVELEKTSKGVEFLILNDKKICIWKHKNVCPVDVRTKGYV